MTLLIQEDRTQVGRPFGQPCHSAEPKPQEGLGPPGECQAHGSPANTTLAGIQVRRDHTIRKARAEAERRWREVSLDLQQAITDAERKCERETARWWAAHREKAS